MDYRKFGVGTKVWFPVAVPGALFHSVTAMQFRVTVKSSAQALKRPLKSRSA